MLSTSERTFKGQTEVLASNIFSHAAFTEMPGEAVCLSESQQGSQILYAALLRLNYYFLHYLLYFACKRKQLYLGKI